jgi:hypothetical protein
VGWQLGFEQISNDLKIFIKINMHQQGSWDSFGVRVYQEVSLNSGT